jgi:hypothetical protein
LDKPALYRALARGTSETITHQPDWIRLAKGLLRFSAIFGGFMGE